MSVVIVAARRTPLGSFLGQFADLSAPELGAAAIQATLGDTRIPGDSIDEVIMGCVLSAGIGQNPARQASLKAGLPSSVPCTTIDKVCGSGMRSVMLAHDMILAASVEIVIAGGMESMSNAPYLLPHARKGQRFGHDTVIDHMLFDGLQNAYDGETMGHFGQICADEFNFKRSDMDEFAVASVNRARQATESGAFEKENCKVEVKAKGTDYTIFDKDEEPYRNDISRIADLKPVFRHGGSVTAASSASLADGAATLMLTSEENAHQFELPILANIIAHTTHAHAPEKFTTAPIGALDKLFKKTGWNANNTELFEINEAFSPVVMATMQHHNIAHEKVNVHGGACALGHPLGASGARILVTLIHALQHHELHKGIAVLCIGGGESTAIAIETPG